MGFNPAAAIFRYGLCAKKAGIRTNPNNSIPAAILAATGHVEVRAMSSKVSFRLRPTPFVPHDHQAGDSQGSAVARQLAKSHIRVT